jgi:Cof subfamily protein (haloacid dehalogenase superfamily)
VSIPGKRPKLIATDLDGTIVSNYGFISERTVAAFTKAHHLGIEIFFVTGRPPRWMEEIRDTFGFGNAICANGALLFDLPTHKVVEKWLISVDSQLMIAGKLRSAIPTISFAIEFDDTFHREIAYVPRWDIGMDNIGVEHIETLMKQPAFKILARCSEGDLSSDEMLEIALRELEGIATVTHSNAVDSLLEISAVGVSKGLILAKMAARAGFTAEECVSFGDNPNDFSMLAWTQRSWAMADGHPDARKYAKFVAEPHQEDGVAKIIEELLLLPE